MSGNPGETGARWRRPSALALLAASLATCGGCSDARPPEPPNAGLPTAPEPHRKTDAKLAYTHEIEIVLPSEAIVAHFAATRDRCLDDATLRCVLLRSSISDTVQSPRRPRAQLRVRLPHASVAAYISFLTSPVAGEAPGSVAVQDQTTQAEDLTRQIDDGSRKLTQLNDYRTRLTELAAKADTRVEDLIRIAQALSQVEAQIEEADAKRRGLDERVDAEIVSVTMRSDHGGGGAFASVREAWTQSGRILGDSAGSALRFALISLPWLPIATVGILLVRTLWRLRRRRRTRSPPLVLERPSS